MNNNNQNILLIAIPSTQHIERFIRIFKNLNDSITIDLFNKSMVPDKKSSLYFDSVYESKHLNNKYSLFYIIPKLRVFFHYFLLSILLIKLLRKKHYDVINIHFITSDTIIFLIIARIYSVPVMLTPWGSDVLRISNFNKVFVKPAFLFANYISVPMTGFRNIIMNKFNINDSKFLNLGLGSETIAEIIKNKTLNNKTILSKLKLPENSFIITCGYNASSAQNHIIMIRALSQIKNILPSNTVLVFPLTYGAEDTQYINTLKKMVDEAQLTSAFFYDYLSIEEVSLLRLASNIFIHIQPTDAFSASLQEYILTDNICINGSWLKYPTLEKYGLPYIQLNKLEDLPEVIKGVLNRSITIPKIDERLKNDIESGNITTIMKEWVKFYGSL